MREEILAALLNVNRLPSPPAVALQIVNAASRPDCAQTEIVALLGTDPALCGKLLKAVNSCLYGLKQPVASVQRAVHVLGLNTVRSLALGLSLPAVKVGSTAALDLRDFWIASVSGAIMARELAALAKRPLPEDELVAGLLRDLGEVLLRQTFPDAWAEHVARHGYRARTEPCATELESFGIDHADVTAELLTGWRFPLDTVNAVRHHHHPERVPESETACRERAELLGFVSQLAQLDAVAQDPLLLTSLFATAEKRYGLSHAALVAFLQQVAPKIEAFAGLLSQDVGQCPDFASVLAVGATELVNLTVENSRSKLSGTVPIGATVREPPRNPSPSHPDATATATAIADGGLEFRPEFRPEFLTKLPESGCRLGEYEVVQAIGRGAMSIVFKAFQPSLRRHVAIKILAAELAVLETSRQRFAREARAVAAIQHDNVVAIYQIGEVAGLPYLAMEHVCGRCLESHVQQHGPMPVPLIVSVGRQIVAGLAASHAKGIVHRDVKPANILVEDETGRAKLIDFGLARASGDANLTVAGSLIGTPYYMAPEIIQGGAATPASDLFGFGGVMYKMATGRVPFAGQSVAAVFHAVTTSELVPPSHSRPNLPPWLDDLILRLLRKNPAERYTDGDAVVAALGGP